MIAEEVSPIVLHKLLKLGAEEFVPYPLPDGALHDAIERMREKDSAGSRWSRRLSPDKPEGNRRPRRRRIPGAWPCRWNRWHNLRRRTSPGNWPIVEVATNILRVCLLDFDLQFGSVSTYLDLPRREAVFELLQDTDIDGQRQLHAGAC